MKVCLVAVYMCFRAGMQHVGVLAIYSEKNTENECQTEPSSFKTDEECFQK